MTAKKCTWKENVSTALGPVHIVLYLAIGRDYLAFLRVHFVVSSRTSPEEPYTPQESFHILICGWNWILPYKHDSNNPPATLTVTDHTR